MWCYYTAVVMHVLRLLKYASVSKRLFSSFFKDCIRYMYMLCACCLFVVPREHMSPCITWNTSSRVYKKTCLLLAWGEDIVLCHRWTLFLMPQDGMSAWGNTTLYLVKQGESTQRQHNKGIVIAKCVWFSLDPRLCVCSFLMLGMCRLYVGQR